MMCISKYYIDTKIENCYNLYCQVASNIFGQVNYINNLTKLLSL
jgi:hypothetical protein